MRITTEPLRITTEYLRACVGGYLLRYPADSGRLSRLTGALREGHPITDPSQTRGHITVTIILVDDEDRVLYGAAGTRQAPSGHLADLDESLPDAALRQLQQVAGISPDLVDMGRLLNIDVRPAACGTGWHYDFQYIALPSGIGRLSLPRETVGGLVWGDLDWEMYRVAGDRIADDGVGARPASKRGRRLAEPKAG